MTFEELNQAISGNFTDKSKGLYDALVEKGNKISFSIGHIENEWSTKVESLEGKSYLITTGGNQVKPNWMAHELMHVQQYVEGFLPPEIIDKTFNGHNSIFGRLFSDNLAIPVINTLGHIRMVDEFISLGFDIDDFLRRTPEQHFFQEIEKDLGCLTKLHQAECLNICRLARRSIIYCGSAVLYNGRSHTELYDKIIQPLSNINHHLIIEIIKLYESWSSEAGYNNLMFFEKLDHLMKIHDVPNLANCQPEQTELVNSICFVEADLSLF